MTPKDLTIQDLRAENESLRQALEKERLLTAELTEKLNAAKIAIGNLYKTIQEEH